MRTPRQFLGDLRAIRRRLGALLRFLATGRLEVSGLVVSDAQGRRRVVLASEVTDAEDLGLAVFDDAGHCRAVVGLTASGPALALFDRNATLRAILEVTENLETNNVFVADGLDFSLLDERGVLRAAVVLSKEETVFFVNERIIHSEPIDPAGRPETKEPV
ncbi:MAG TPA: hypothetical protein VGD06_16570 [Acidobacteriota bacterium]